MTTLQVIKGVKYMYERKSLKDEYRYGVHSVQSRKAWFLWKILATPDERLTRKVFQGHFYTKREMESYMKAKVDALQIGWVHVLV